MIKVEKKKGEWNRECNSGRSSYSANNFGLVECSPWGEIARRGSDRSESEGKGKKNSTDQKKETKTMRFTN